MVPIGDRRRTRSTGPRCPLAPGRRYVMAGATFWRALRSGGRYVLAGATSWPALRCFAVAAFESDTDLSQDRAFRLMANTPVTLFWRRQILEEATGWLSTHGYQVVRLDAAQWISE